MFRVYVCTTHFILSVFFVRRPCSQRYCSKNFRKIYCPCARKRTKSILKVPFSPFETRSARFTLMKSSLKKPSSPSTTSASYFRLSAPLLSPAICSKNFFGNYSLLFSFPFFFSLCQYHYIIFLSTPNFSKNNCKNKSDMV